MPAANGISPETGSPNGAQAASSFHREIPSTLPNVSVAVRALAEFCAGQIEDTVENELAVEQVELCASEALSNVVIHAYERRETELIRVQCERQGGRFVLQIIDNGKELPTRLLKQTNGHPFNGRLQDLPESGFGWFLIMDQMDDVKYQRLDGVNYLTLTKRLP